MVKLSDYMECVEAKILLQQMGVLKIPSLPEVEFVRKIVKTKYRDVPNTGQLQFAERMKLESIPINAKDISIGNDGLLEVNGVKCCAYIKNQRQGIVYRFHLCNCQKIQEMVRDGRGGRYVATSRDDGLFVVTPQGDSYRRAHEQIIALELCSYCRDILKGKGMYSTPFSLKTFYSKYQPDIPKTFKRPEQVEVTEQYAPNHSEIAHKYKEQSGYKCQLCGVDCSSNTQCLHLHHIDGDGVNNRVGNIRIYCTICHSKQPLHAHMKKNPRHIYEMETIHRLRDEQGIIALS